MRIFYCFRLIRDIKSVRDAFSVRSRSRQALHYKGHDALGAMPTYWSLIRSVLTANCTLRLWPRQTQFLAVAFQYHQPLRLIHSSKFSSLHHIRRGCSRLIIANMCLTLILWHKWVHHYRFLMHQLLPSLVEYRTFYSCSLHPGNWFHYIYRLLQIFYKNLD